MDVPLLVCRPLPERAAAETMPTPGALMSGFNSESPRRGPRAVKLATASTGERLLCGLASACVDEAATLIARAATPGPAAM